MKSEFRKGDTTLGTQLREKKNTSKIEIGEFIHEMGKTYMKNIEEIINTHQNIKEYFIQVICVKEFFAEKQNTISLRFIVRKSKPIVEDDMDIWFVNNNKGFLKCLWSMPHWTEMRFVLDHKKDLDPILVKGVEEYQKI